MAGHWRGCKVAVHCSNSGVELLLIPTEVEMVSGIHFGVRLIFRWRTALCSE